MATTPRRSSLPPSPDPHSIAQDIHNHAPKLTRKPTISRASQAMINALFDDDVPTLNTFTDLFGFWRRDYDLARKLGKELTPTKLRATRSRAAYYLSSSLHLAHRCHTYIICPPGSGRSTRPLIGFLLFLTLHPLRVRSVHPSLQGLLRRMVPPGSSYNSPSGTSALASSSVSRPPRHVTPASRQPSIALQDIPIRFGHVPEALFPTDRLDTGISSRRLRGVGSRRENGRPWLTLEAARWVYS